jgi:hypothetical protein
LRLRQVALVARDLERAMADVSETFDLAPPFHDPGVGVFGLHNAVFVLGDTFLEIVSPVRDDASAGRFLARKGADAGYMAIFQSNDLARERRRLVELGVRIVFEHALEDIATIHIHPRDIGGAIVSLDEARPPQSWRWAGEGWERKRPSTRVGALRGVEIAACDAPSMAARWAEVLELGPATERDGIHTLALEGGSVRVTACGDARGEGIAVVEVETFDRRSIIAAAERRGLATTDGEVSVCGARFRLLEAVEAR